MPLCPTCDKPADPKEFTEKINEKESKLNLLNSKMESLGEKKNQAIKLLRSLRDYEKAIAKLDGLEKQLTIHKESITQSKEQIRKLTKQIREDQGFVMKAKEKHEQLKKVEDLIKILR